MVFLWLNNRKNHKTIFLVNYLVGKFLFFTSIAFWETNFLFFPMTKSIKNQKFKILEFFVTFLFKNSSYINFRNLFFFRKKSSGSDLVSVEQIVLSKNAAESMNFVFDLICTWFPLCVFTGPIFQIITYDRSRAIIFYFSSIWETCPWFCRVTEWIV